MKGYGVEYNGWTIKVEADNKNQAKYLSWLKFNDVYPTKFIDFVRNVSNVFEL